jgi:signal transduction histidine kinase/ligand-binding sensor domain-containing protein
MFSKLPLLLSLASALFLTTGAQQVNFIKYTVQDGLVANPVRCIYQDSKGFIWIGTYEGLSRYDGYKFTNYTNTNGLSNNFINSIIEVNGKLLIAQNGGAIDIIQNNTIKKRLMATSAVNIVKPYKDRLLVTTDASGFYEYNDDTIFAPLQEKTGTALGHFISINDSLLLCDGVDNNLILYKQDLSVQAFLNKIPYHFYFFLQDSKKRIWACTSGGLRLLKIAANKRPYLSFATLPKEFDFFPLNKSPVTSMVEEKDGTFWIATMKGLVHLHANGKYHVYNEKDGLPSAIINTLYHDKEKNLWIGTALGLAKWVSANNVAFYNTEEKEFKNDINTIHYLGNKKLFVSTEHGPQQLNIHTGEFKDLAVPKSGIYAAVAGTVPLLVHYGDKIGMFDGLRNTLLPYEKLDSPVNGVLFSFRHPDGAIFLGTYGGLFSIRNRSTKKILSFRITSLAIDRNNNVWVGTWENGLFRLTGNSNKGYDIKDVTAAIGQKQIRGLYVDSKQNIWVGTRHAGAFCLKSKPGDKFDIQCFDRQSGLFSNWVSSFAEAKNGDVWVGTYLGLDKLVKGALGYRVFNFSKTANFFAEIRDIVLMEENTLVCVANKGIAHFKDEGLHETPPLQATILSTSFGITENKFIIHVPSNKIFLKANQNAARFEFSALGFINERQIMYSYRLKGNNDTAWSNPENIHEAYYASLSPGEYTFEVKTVGWNGQHGMPATVSFFISTPFWKQWWFIGLVILSIAALFYLLYRYRISQLLRLQNVRNSIATDLHDDIGSSLTNISILSELGSKNLAQPEKAQPFLQRISEEVQASSQAMDDIIWSVNTRNDSLQETIARMRRYAAELFDNSKTNCHLKLDEDTGSKKLSMEQRRDVYLIYKEALTNIHKHATANNVWIEVNQNQNHLFMQIKDDGKGFNTEHITNRNGLKNLRSRVEKWNGKIGISARENKGTDIEIKIPLKD